MSDTPLKIVQINASDVGGGAERSVLSLHSALQKLGHESIFYVGRKQSEESGVIEIPYDRGVPGTRRAARWLEETMGWQDIYNPSFRKLTQLIPQDTDVVHFHNLWGTGGYADLWALPTMTKKWPGIFTERQQWSFTGHCACFHDCERWKTGCGSCPDLTLHPAIPKDGTAFNWRRKKRLIQESALTFVGVSDYVCSLALQSPLWEGKAIERIYDGIDLTVFKPVSSDQKSALRLQRNIPSDRVAVLVTGQTLNGFRTGIATEGFDALNELDDPAVLPVLVGVQTEDAVKRLNRPCITLPYCSTPSEMAECFQACDLTLVTSQVEAFGRIAAESQACGTPVVTFDTGGLAEVVKDGVGGVSVVGRDLKGLITGFQKMVSDNVWREELGRDGSKYVAKHFEEGLIASQYISLYKKVIS